MKNIFSEDNQEWNINKGFGIVLINLIEQINKWAIEGNTIMWFNSLRVLYFNISTHKKMNKDVMAEIDLKLMDVLKKFPNNPVLTEFDIKRNNKILSEIRLELDRLTLMLIGEMHNADIIFPIWEKTIGREVLSKGGRN